MRSLWTNLGIAKELLTLAGGFGYVKTVWGSAGIASRGVSQFLPVRIFHLGPLCIGAVGDGTEMTEISPSAHSANRFFYKILQRLLLISAIF
jgi:hypothetical protein